MPRSNPQYIIAASSAGTDAEAGLEFLKIINKINIKKIINDSNNWLFAVYTKPSLYFCSPGNKAIYSK